MTRIKLVEVPSGIGAGKPGAAAGIKALKNVGAGSENNVFRDLQPLRIRVNNAVAGQPSDTPFAKNIDEIKPVYERLVKCVAEMDEDELLLVLSGDHSSAGGTVRAVSAAHPEKRLGVIWVDAHADLHSPYTTPSGNVHGMPLAAATAEDNRECAINDVSGKALELWEGLKAVGKSVLPQDICFIGVRSTEPPEEHLMTKYGMNNITVAQVRGQGADAAAMMALNYLKDCDLIYISFDVDSMDPGISRGTGTPVEDGLLLEETKTLLKRLAGNEKVCAFEIVEVNPSLDKEKPMAVPAYEVLAGVIRVMQNR